MFRSSAISAKEIVLVVVTVCLLGADKPQRQHAPPKSSPVLKPIPVGAIKIPLPDIQQPDEYSCGAASLMSICSYYGVGPKKVEEFEKQLHADPKEGIYYKNIARYAGKLGLQAEIEAPMSIKRLKQYIDQGKPVICSLQAYSDDPSPDYTKNGDGHYVVAIGYDKEDNFYFMDPSANYERVRANPRYACLTRQELELRWHEDEGMKGEQEVYRQLGIAVFPDPKKAEPLLQARVME
jgi:predicted double-glycine peptidase